MGKETKQPNKEPGEQGRRGLESANVSMADSSAVFAADSPRQKFRIIGQRLKAREKRARKSENFLVFRMWWNTFFSLFRSDRGTIPFDIGSGIYLGENQYITGKYMSNCFLVTEYSLQTPIAKYEKEMLGKDLP